MLNHLASAAFTDAGFSYFINIGTSEPRRAFNNILVAVYTSDSQLRPIAFLAPTGERDDHRPLSPGGLPNL